VTALLQIAPEGRLILAQDAVRSTKSWVLHRNLTQPREGRLIFSQGRTLGPGSSESKALSTMPSIGTTPQKRLQPIIVHLHDALH
jgi:hypothetical protein